MKFILFVLLTYVLGFISAIPIGAVQLEIVRRAIHGHLKSALMVSIGAVSADILYGIIAFFGLLPILKNKKIMAIFWFVGGIILIFVGFSIVRQGLQHYSFNSISTNFKHRGVSFITGFSIALTNPMMILWWLLGERIIVEFGLISNFTYKIKFSFLAIGGIGMFSYPGLLATALCWLKKFLSIKAIMKITLFSGIFILLFSFYLIIKSLIIILSF